MGGEEGKVLGDDLREVAGLGCGHHGGVMAASRWDESTEYMFRKMCYGS